MRRNPRRARGRGRRGRGRRRVLRRRRPRRRRRKGCPRARARARARGRARRRPGRPRRSSGDVRFGTRGVARTRRVRGPRRARGRGPGSREQRRPRTPAKSPSTTEGPRGRSRRARGAQTRVPPPRLVPTHRRGRRDRPRPRAGGARVQKLHRGRRRRLLVHEEGAQALDIGSGHGVHARRGSPRATTCAGVVLARETDLTSLDVTSRTVPLATRGHALEFGTRARVTPTHRRADTPG